MVDRFITIEPLSQNACVFNGTSSVFLTLFCKLLLSLQSNLKKFNKKKLYIIKQEEYKVMKINGIEDEIDLKRAQAAAQAGGTAIPNYHEWANVMKDLELAGVESTGSYEGDKALREEIERQIDKFLEEAEEAKKAQEAKEQTQQVKETSETDNEQEIKANLANATSSMIMADYMKYYHLMS